MKEFIIGKTKIGGDNPCFIVAEIGINFDGKYEQAVKLIDIAKNAGCNAVKFQLFSADKMYTTKAGEYKKATGEKGDIFKLVKEAELPHLWIPKLKKYAEDNNLEFFLTVCDEDSADILENYGISAYKIASYEITHEALIRHVAKKKKPVLFSCGGASMEEIEDAVKIFKEEKNNNVALLHCIARYPAPLESLNLNIIRALEEKFPQLVIGYSDHSLDPISAPVAAVLLGAKIIEKHITLDRNLPGNDHYCAINPEELSLMVKATREAEEKMRKGMGVKIDKKLLGSMERETLKEERAIRDFAYRCIFAKKSIKKGQPFNKNNIVILRAGNQKRGLEPKYYDSLIKDYVAGRNIGQNESVKAEDIVPKIAAPKITVIVRAYNSENFIKKSINSILRQTINPDFYEILVIDDGSSDNTIKILKSYGRKITLVKQRHKGHIKALNSGIKKAKGENIILLDADDTFEPKILEKLIDILEKNNKAQFAYCDYYEIKDGRKKRVNLRNNIFNSVAGGIMFRKKILEEMGGYDESMVFPEYDLLIKIIKKHKGAHIPEPLFTYVRHGQSITANKETVKKGMNQLIKKYGDIKNIRRY